MNDDYLWDKSGDPDPQIQQLEEILGSLRYQPKPLQLPEELPVAPRRNYVPWLAIAATVAIALLTGGLWLQSQRREPAIPAVALSQPVAPIQALEPVAPIQALPVSAPSQTFKKRRLVPARYDRKEALAAKQQLMFALRLASEKLNAAHRRAQDKRSSYEDNLPN